VSPFLQTLNNDRRAIMKPDHAEHGPLQHSANRLGYAGLLPQAFALFLVLDGANRYVGLAAGYFYAALILSFLGGLWWGLAAGSPKAERWVYVAAVVPSLLAFATGIPWMNGTSWPGPSLIILGIALIVSLAVDLRLKRLELMSKAMFTLRVRLSLGLGALTLVLGVLA
jgi:hypothetical protein